MENPLAIDAGADPDRPGDPQPDPGQCPGRHRADQRARHRALDLLLVTELTPKEFIYGKLYGILYNSKEMIALPVLTAIAMAFLGTCSAAKTWCSS